MDDGRRVQQARFARRVLVNVPRVLRSADRNRELHREPLHYYGGFRVSRTLTP